MMAPILKGTKKVLTSEGIMSGKHPDTGIAKKLFEI